MPVKNRFAELLPEITAWRRDLHAHPEIRFGTHRTAKLVAERLAEFGCDEVTTGIGQTGVVAVIRGKSNESGRVIGLRADMDALPITETTGVPHASTTPGAMHACGHDGHTAILLGAARYLAETRNFDGTVVLIFQPDEEGGGGALAMCEDGLMDRWGIEEVYGLHNMPGLPVGEFAIRPGPLLAAVDSFVITVTGRGGHGAMPHAAVDTTLAASQIVSSLQSVVARSVDPLKNAVLSVCSFRTDTDAFNVIPDQAVLKGTVRTFEPDVRDLVEARLTEIATATATAFGAKADVVYDRMVAPTINAADNAAFAADVAEAVSGSVRRDIDPIMAGEDFAFMLEQRPGAYIMLGNGDSAMVHHPAYDFNDEAIPAGCSWFAELVERRMPAA
jgi:amidohydrolase